MSNMSYKKNFIEFFAGAGLVRAGLNLDGWFCSWANDICPDKKDAYVSNFSSDDFVLDDIWDLVEDNEIPSNIFLATASFPCTDLSVAGARKGLKGKQSGALLAFLNILEGLKAKSTKPPVLLLENVQGFLTSNGGQDVAFTLEKLNDLDYTSTIVEVDARYFTPQSRPRVFVIAVSKELAPALMATYANQEKWNSYIASNPICYTKKIQKVLSENASFNTGVLNLPPFEEKSIKLKDVIQDLDDSSNYWWSEERTLHLYNQMSDKHRAILQCMTNRDSISYGTVFRRVRQGKSMAELRTDGIAGCLRTPKGGSSKQILIQAGHGSFKVRFMIPREYARLQGVNDTFNLPENDTKAYFAMGDAVCVPAIEWISKEILSKYFDKWKLTQKIAA
ncbi:DNA cytosine methyltransferase [Photobacterium sanguinicancri]|uniref:DNA (cytosine-5-)-methyltransferase n=1 Tax=Photobacterium sanguinicancri TaxID=875932 RepID=A0AAW7Y529_9GAMM|nr:DNA (cytosine-5-)-methyltransferase [Photobacterium sanguinicancri]MDO6543487.1 DNA (cytosine-5-)-methyltransferase [Photobacterium sanguinicancri]